MDHTIENKILSRIYGRGRGLVFSQKDFTLIGNRSSIDKALSRIEKKGKIKRIIRGVYEYPRYSAKLQIELSPDIDQVALAIARKFGWRIQPSGPAALNILGLSTQVPGKYVYLSDGPNRTYTIGNSELVFRKISTKESGFQFHQSAIIVQALKSLGKEQITPKVIATMREWLDPKLRGRILKDTQTVTGWVFEAIREICCEEIDG